MPGGRPQVGQAGNQFQGQQQQPNQQQQHPHVSLRERDELAKKKWQPIVSADTIVDYRCGHEDDRSVALRL